MTAGKCDGIFHWIAKTETILRGHHHHHHHHCHRHHNQLTDFKHAQEKYVLPKHELAVIFR